MKFLFVPFLLTSVFVDAQTPISEARNMRSGKVVTINGIVTGVFGDLAFVEDITGGIAVYGATVDLYDSLSVRGTLSKYNGMLEIVVDSLNNFGFKKSVVPKEIGVGNVPDHEGALIRLTNVSFPKTELFFYPKRTGFIKQENDSIQYWIDEETDIAGCSVPKGLTGIVGIVGRFGNTLQILPRSHFDILMSDIETPITNGQFTVANWNVEFFGAPRYGPSDDTLQISNVAKVLNMTQPDIVALQEVSNDGAFGSLLLKLPSYEGLCSSRFSYSFDTSGDFPPQKVCFVYKTSTVKVIRQKILFVNLFDEKPSDMFSSGRLPYLLEIEAMGQRLVLINLHAKSGAEEVDFKRRLWDARLLKDTLDAFDRPLILLGDFNDDVDESIVAGHESPYSEFINSDRYFCVSKELSEAGWYSTISYEDMIDHQVISSALRESHAFTRILNPFMIPRYGRTTSDHLPLISGFDLNRTIAGIKNNEVIPVYPNPTRDKIWFPPNSNITVFNSLGAVVIKQQGAHPPISLGECAPGLYLVVLEDQVYKITRN